MWELIFWFSSLLLLRLVIGFNENLAWDDIFTTWVIKHGITNPFKPGVHYMN